MQKDAYCNIVHSSVRLETTYMSIKGNWLKLLWDLHMMLQRSE